MSQECLEVLNLRRVDAQTVARGKRVALRPRHAVVERGRPTHQTRARRVLVVVTDDDARKSARRITAHDDRGWLLLDRIDRAAVLERYDRDLRRARSNV